MFIMFLQPKCEFSEDFCAGSVPKWSRWWQAGRSSEVGSARESIFGLHIYIYILDYIILIIYNIYIITHYVIQ